MLLSLTLVLVGSCLAMVVLFYAKHWELTTGRVFFAPLRPYFSSTANSFIIIFGYRVPGFFMRIVRGIVNWMRGSARDMLARFLIALERALERALGAVRRGFVAPRAPAGEPSSFLREVAERKRKLTRITRMRRTPKDSNLVE